MLGEAEEFAHTLNVTVVTGDPPFGWWGCWDPDRRLITLRSDLGPVQARSTLWHELGHAVHDHVGRTARNERQATVWAAHRLISLDQFIEAARLDANAQSIAHRLDVLPRDVEAYTSSLSAAEKVMLEKLL
ncbi:ImmA/IrrE family metallo-endopeptidase [Arthrobacter sp. NPDC090010]|uniref:ImmA/IrrE family metallo-endopeptidase n=1 Tax=Arthrobacter sp. NPDC090010 TaxID=3363942 RepID=UPI0037F87AC8